MTGRRVFFSFHYECDVWRAGVVRNAGQVDSRAAAGWTDSSLWEKAKARGPAAVRQLIDNGLDGTSVTAVLIGANTADRPWVRYEIERSVARGNGILGIRVHGIRDQKGRRTPAGAIPDALRLGNYPVYAWDRTKLGMWVEWSAVAAGRRCLDHAKVGCARCRRPWWA